MYPLAKQPIFPPKSAYIHVVQPVRKEPSEQSSTRRARVHVSANKLLAWGPLPARRRSCRARSLINQRPVRDSPADKVNRLSPSSRRDYARHENKSKGQRGGGSKRKTESEGGWGRRDTGEPTRFICMRNERRCTHRFPPRRHEAV